MKTYLFTVCVLVLADIHDVISRSASCKNVQTCQPTFSDVATFERSLQGTLLLPNDKQYTNMTHMFNGYYAANPTYVVMVQDARDVQKSLEFARRHGIRVTIYSSGHDLIGRSTADKSLQINFSLYKNTTVDVNDSRSDTGSSVTAEAGAAWIDVYREVDKFHKIAVGGCARSVSVSGYTMGGGYGPLSRSFGLAVDNVIEFTIVLYDGTIAKCNKTGTDYPEIGYFTSDTDLFWAVRGGGGGTFGVVLSFTFKIYDAPSQFVAYKALYLIDNNTSSERDKDLYRQVFDLISRLPREWGGCITSLYKSFAVSPKPQSWFMLTLLQYGPWNEKTESVKFTESVIVPQLAVFTNHATFLHYETSFYYFTRDRSLSTNIFIDSKQATSKHYDFFGDQVITPRLPGVFTGCIWTLIGGKASEANKDSAVSEAFRNSDISSTCWVSWDDPALDQQAEGVYAYFESIHENLGNRAYLNEAAYNIKNWKKKFWNSNYQRLLDIKHRVDPENMFTCHHCVGSDEVMDGGRQRH